MFPKRINLHNFDYPMTFHKVPPALEKIYQLTYTFMLTIITFMVTQKETDIMKRRDNAALSHYQKACVFFILSSINI